MLVLKFGGTSVGSAERMKEVAELIKTPETKIVVLSAMSGTTNSLVEIAEYLYQKNIDAANEKINLLVLPGRWAFVFKLRTCSGHSFSKASLRRALFLPF